MRSWSGRVVRRARARCRAASPQPGQHDSTRANSPVSGRCGPRLARAASGAATAWSFQSAPARARRARRTRCTASHRPASRCRYSPMRMPVAGDVARARRPDRASRPSRSERISSRRAPRSARLVADRHDAVDLARGLRRRRGRGARPRRTASGIAVDRIAVAAAAHEAHVLDVARARGRRAPRTGRRCSSPRDLLEARRQLVDVAVAEGGVADVAARVAAEEAEAHRRPGALAEQHERPAAVADAVWV